MRLAHLRRTSDLRFVPQVARLPVAVALLMLVGCGAGTVATNTPPSDTTPPTTPSGLTATAVSGTQINLNWNASTDNVGVTGYQVQRCQGAGCSNFAQIATPTTTTYSDTGLTPATSYTYRVRAIDAAGNVSGFSSTATAATPDTIPPTAPSNLAATAVSSSQINLTWTASTDNVGVTGYQVQRCQGAGCSNFAQIAAPTTTTYSDTGLAASTSYSYRVRATDAAGNLSGFSNVASATTSASGGAISVTLTPRQGGITTSQTIAFTATVTNDVGAQGVTWTETGGSLTGQTATSAMFSSSTAGFFTITATSVADSAQSASATIGVTDLSGYLTWRYDNTRAGANQQEYALTPANVSGASGSGFGKLFACAVDSPVYAEPLWVPNLNIGGGTHNVIFVATVHDTVYAFDADNTTCQTYWQQSLLGADETWVSSTDVNSTDITPDIGIIGTPVIDPAETTLYVVAKSKAVGSNCTPSSNCYQRLHALSLTTGAELFGGPVEISATVSGIGDGSTTVTFNPLTQNQRPALTYLDGVVYAAWASHGDNPPYHGWIIGYTASNLSLPPLAVFNATPDGSLGGIWMGGNGLAADAAGNLYTVTGNGTYDGALPLAPLADDFGDSVLQFNVSSGISLTDFFTPNDQLALADNDIDLGAGGIVILPDQTSGIAHLLFISSKSGTIYLLNRDNLGQYNTQSDQVVQEFLGSGGGFWSTPAFWQNTMYGGGAYDNVAAWAFSHNTPGQFDGSPSSTSPTAYNFPGASPAVSSSGTSNGIVWAIDSGAYGTPCCANGPAVLHAYDATNVGNELWNSSSVASDQAGDAVKLTVPLVANGKVYVGTRSEISVYGLKP